MIGTRIKEAIEASNFSAEQIAVEAEMSISNLQKIYKRDSIETRYLVRICRKLEIPYSQLLGPEDWLESDASGSGHSQVASRVKSNNQNISVGANGNDEMLRLRHELQLCQVQREGLEQQLAFHKEMIEVLKNK